MKKYALHKKIYENKKTKSYIWEELNIKSDDLMTLKSFCSSGGFRIFDRINGMVIYAPTE